MNAAILLSSDVNHIKHHSNGQSHIWISIN
jgi:hypothetical protein